MERHMGNNLVVNRGEPAKSRRRVGVLIGISAHVRRTVEWFAYFEVSYGVRSPLAEREAPKARS